MLPGLGRDFRGELENFQEMGEEEVRYQLVQGRLQGQRRDLAVEWLASKEAGRSSEREAQKSAREERALELASEANSIAHRANKIAAIAMIIAVLSTILSIWSSFRGGR